MELTVIRSEDRRRMVVSVEATTETEALQTIGKAMGPVTLALRQLSVRKRRGPVGDQHARPPSNFSYSK